LAYFILSIYVFALIYITVYCLSQLNLLYHYLKQAKHKAVLEEIPTEKDWPFVTVQLPIFNEMYVVDRLIDKICEFDYPKDKFEIQIIDDSTDETVEISKRKVAEYKAKGFDIKMVQRNDRVGYKAGALKHANESAKGDYLAIFDADFLPRKDFLKATVPYFDDEKVGVVQTRWEHINQDYSLITKLQALQLNVHFTVEQSGRKAGNFLLQFNGTAGVWRKACIDDAGGWEADTLTEDLDLSYRAQMKGWEIKYLEKFGSPAELPAEMNALKSQQFRWMKGGAENARKLLPKVWKSDMPFSKKLQATSHLMSSGVFMFILLAGLVSVPLVFLLETIVVDVKYFAVFLISMLCVIAVYYVANVEAELNRKSYLKTLLKFVLLFPVFLSLSMGLSLHNTIAVLQGYRGKKSPFIRTPKFNIKNITDSFQKENYMAKKLPWTTIFEGILAIYFIGGIVAGMYLQNTTFLAFHTLLAFGFGTICFYSVRHYTIK
jgi:cellulose synthase/poly-beta-1,6-N-acetylglucosamine synthase-like glycosyltransferase